MAVTKTDTFDFLIDIVPREDIKTTKKLNDDLTRHLLQQPEALPPYFYPAMMTQPQLDSMLLYQQQQAQQQQQQHVSPLQQVPTQQQQQQQQQQANLAQQAQQLRLIQQQQLLQQLAAMQGLQSGAPGQLRDSPPEASAGQDESESSE
jgi:hypothetical protein